MACCGQVDVDWPVAEAAGPECWWVRHRTAVLARFYGDKAEAWAKVFLQLVGRPG